MYVVCTLNVHDVWDNITVESLGGSVTWHGRRDKAGKPIENTGVYRVNRNLALSRSMGDRYMRPYVIAEPDFVRMPITSEDEFVVGKGSFYFVAMPLGLQLNTYHITVLPCQQKMSTRDSKYSMFLI